MHYTDKEIYDMLRPKLMKNFPELDWSDEHNQSYETYRVLQKVIALVYRSGYGRGQKGRDFMIGQHKTDKYDPYEVINKRPEYGDMVRMVANCHESMPAYYPPVGVVGVVTSSSIGDTCWVKWPEGTTEGRGIWCVNNVDIEVVQCK